MKVQLSADEVSAIVAKFCKDNLPYEPVEGTIQLVTDEDSLFMEFEVHLDVIAAKKT